MDTRVQGAMLRPEIETRTPDEQRARDRAAYRR